MPSSSSTANTGNTGTTGPAAASKFSWNQPANTTNTFKPTDLQNTLGHDITTGLEAGPTINTNPGYAGQGATTQGGLTGLLNASASPTYAADSAGALNSIGATAAGANLNGQDPYFRANLDKSLNDAATGVNAAFGANGRFGSGGQVEQLGSTLGHLSDQAYSTNYAQSKQDQMSAAGMLPQLYQGMLAPSQTRLGVGAAQDANAQATLTDQNRITDLKSNAPYQHIANYLGLLNSGNPNSSTGSLAQTTTTTQNPFLSALGYAGSLASLFL